MPYIVLPQIITDAMLGPDAITNAKIADNALAAEQFAADAITNAKIADNAFASEQFAATAVTRLTRGIEVVKVAAALPQTGHQTLFTVTGGRILLMDIIGEVTAQIGAVPNDTKIQLAAANDLCAVADVDTALVGTMFSITGTVANPMVLTLAHGVVPVQAAGFVVDATTIGVRCAASDGGNGRVAWVCHFIPLQAGATVS